MKPGMKTDAAKTVDEYLDAVPEDARETLQRLRRTIKEAAPDATEVISYHMPIFKHHGMLVGFAAFKEHCSFFAMSTAVMKRYKKELKAYDTSKGTIRFGTDRPLPAALVKKIVRARVAENEVRFRERESRKKKR